MIAARELSVVLVAVALFAATPAPAQVPPTITEAITLTGNSQPFGITLGPDGAVWFVEYAGNKVGRITPAGVVTEFPIAPTSGPRFITLGPDGNLWFTENTGNKIGRITTGGVLTEFPVPTGNSQPFGITSGSDGALWFTENIGNKIGRITTSGVVTEFPVITGVSQPGLITSGPDGALWFTENNSNKIGRITTAGAVTEFTVPSVMTRPYKITPGLDGALWFTEFQGNRIGRITTAGVVTEFSIPTPGSGPTGITAGSDGALWFTEYNGNKIGRITPFGVITEYTVPTPLSAPLDIASGPDGALWFTETSGSKIGRAALALNWPSVVPASGSGLNQILTTRFTDSAGYANISVANVLIHSVLDGRNACYLAYVASTNTLYLVNDGGDAGGPYAGAMILDGGAGAVENSQCRITAAGSLASGVDTSLILTLNVTFKAAFAGNRIVHLAQRDIMSFTSGWQRVGVWQVPGASPTPITVTGQDPGRGVSTTNLFQPVMFTLTDVNGYADLGVVNLLMNDFIDGRISCYLAYVVATNQLFLVNDAGDGGGPFAGQLTVNGSAASIENNQCRVNGVGSSASGSGNTLTLTLNLLFKGAFLGNRVMYSAARNQLDGNNTGWQPLGTWTIP